MNKQEAMKILTDTKHDYEFCWSNDFRTGFFEGIDCSLKTIKQIDEPEKPILTKEEAEWLEHLKLIGNFTYCLYIITRQGWGYDFEFSSHGKKYKLSCANKNDGDENELTKNRLVNALIYGYEVKKEKLYTVFQPATNEFLYTEPSGSLRSDAVTWTYAAETEEYHFTQQKLEELNYWENPAFEIKEVEND